MIIKKKLLYLIRYVVVWACGLAIIIGLLALLFEESLLIRATGGVSALVAAIIGNLVWKKKTSSAQNGSVESGES